jgi:hypothetical protein
VIAHSGENATRQAGSAHLIVRGRQLLQAPIPQTTQVGESDTHAVALLTVVVIMAED